MNEVGMRVFAVRNGDADTKTLNVFGAGVYAGDFLRPGAGEPPLPGDEDYEQYKDVIFGQRAQEFAASIDKMLDDDLASGKLTQEQYDANKAHGLLADKRNASLTETQRIHALWVQMNMNPRIDLDNGKTTWGMECWWGPEDQMRERYPESEWTYVEVESILS